MGKKAREREAKEAEKQAKAAAEAELRSLQNRTIFNAKELKALNRRFKGILARREKPAAMQAQPDQARSAGAAEVDDAASSSITRAEFMGMPELVSTVKLFTYLVLTKSYVGDETLSKDRNPVL
jgi:hypothetical protein